MGRRLHQHPLPISLHEVLQDLLPRLTLGHSLPHHVAHVPGKLGGGVLDREIETNRTPEDRSDFADLAVEGRVGRRRWGWCGLAPQRALVREDPEQQSREPEPAAQPQLPRDDAESAIRSLGTQRSRMSGVTGAGW